MQNLMLWIRRAMLEMNSFSAVGSKQRHSLQLGSSVSAAPGVEQQIVVSLLLEISVILARVGRRKDALEVSTSAVLADELDQHANVVWRQLMQDRLLITNSKSFLTYTQPTSTLIRLGAVA